MITFQNVHLHYDTGMSLRDFSFQIEPGEFVYLSGPSGAGKSTALKLIYCELFPNAGSVRVLGKDTFSCNRRCIGALRRQIGMHFQEIRLLKDRDVYSNIALPLEIMGVGKDLIRSRIVKYADDLGLRSRLFHFPDELSLGEQQRVALLRAVVPQPKILLLDEPLAHQDAGQSETLVKWLWTLNQDGLTILFATYDDQVIQDEPARTLSLDAGALIEDYPA